MSKLSPFFLYESVSVHSHWAQLLSSCVECIYGCCGNSVQDTRAKLSHETLLALCSEPHNLKGSSAWQRFHILHENCNLAEKKVTVCVSACASFTVCELCYCQHRKRQDRFLVLCCYLLIQEPRTFPCRATDRPSVALKYRVAHLRQNLWPLYFFPVNNFFWEIL